MSLSEKISPWRIWSFFSFILIFLGMSLLFIAYLQHRNWVDENGYWYISKDSSLALRLPVWQLLLTKKNQEKPNISHLRKKYETYTYSTQEKTAPKKNKITQQKQVIQKNSHNNDSLTENQSTQIQFSGKQMQALEVFFSSLQNLENQNKKELIRIIHYGDSQLEGDRISSQLRRQLQSIFGGCGTGINPAHNLHNEKLTLLQENDDKWQIYTILSLQKKRPPHSYFGILGKYFQITDTSAFVSFRPSKKANQTEKTLENIKILYKNSTNKATLNINDGKNEEKYDLTAQQNFQILSIPLQSPFEKLTLNFSVSPNFDLYGIALDCPSGIAVDNAPLRGSAGLEFEKINFMHLKEQYKQLNTKLIILQFGVNVDLRGANFNFYENLFYKQLLLLKKAAPEASILVVGTSDRAYKNLDEYNSYPNLPLLRDAQRRAAFRAGCAFWDLYAAMGGQNSMAVWVKENLAGKDYTHFKIEGANLVGNMLFEALMQAYEAYKQNRIK
ncbi:MAG: hypothetical protein SFU27_13680 [Thermonemataceae bacterium]|nr:hypothetical protein [Thermonemataceae bacterium]